MSTARLNKDIFNPTLYKQMRSVWFDDHDIRSEDIKFDTIKKWFMGSRKQSLLYEFDGVCRDHFGAALDSIGPGQFVPSAEPFLQEITGIAQNDPQGDGSEAAWTALSLVLLLDQMPRNLYRTNEGLVKVYSHYDKMAFALVQALLSPDSPIGRPDLHPQWRKTLIYRVWFYLPLMHSEDLKAHDQHDKILDEYKEKLDREEGREKAKEFFGQAIKSGKEHRDILERFGRYPHRNRALGRPSTEEEKKFLAQGGSTFGVAQE